MAVAVSLIGLGVVVRDQRHRASRRLYPVESAEVHRSGEPAAAIRRQAPERSATTGRQTIYDDVLPAGRLVLITVKTVQMGVSPSIHVAAFCEWGRR